MQFSFSYILIYKAYPPTTYEFNSCRAGLNPRRYQRDFKQKMIVTEYQGMCIVYGDMPKSGSSTIRLWLKTLGHSVPTYGHVENLTQTATPDQRVAELLLRLRSRCLFFTFIRDPVDRYISGLYESHRYHPEEVNVTALTYAFAAASNDDLTWKSIDHRQNSIFNVGQLDYLRTRSSESPLSESVWDFVGRYEFECPCPFHTRTLSPLLLLHVIFLSFFFILLVGCSCSQGQLRLHSTAPFKIQCMLTCVRAFTWLLALMPSWCTE